MKFTSFTQQIPAIQSKPLGGLNSQFKLAPKLRLAYSEEKIQEKKPRIAAIMALLYPDANNETRLLLTQRASYKGTHSAQISFPGGKTDSTDASLQATALRETYEEVGIAPTDITVIRELTNAYIPPSNFLVTPFIGIAKKQPVFTPNNEVANIIEVYLKDLLDNTNLSSQFITTSYMNNTKVPCFTLNNYIVWGATAMMLSEIKDLLK